MRDDSGFALLEVIVAGALVAVIGVGVYAGIDGPAQISGQSRLKSAAASLAEQDQDRLRSMDFDRLQAYGAQAADAPYTKTLNGTTFTVSSASGWVEDASGTPSCTNSDSSADYLQISSSVTWPGASRPVVLRSLESPPSGTGSTRRGNLSVKITDQAGGPVSGLPVQITGRTTMTRTTNAVGCAVFTYIPVGQYHVLFQRPGWVDPTGLNAVDKTTTVSGNSTSTESYSYAQAARIDISFDDSAGTARAWTSATVAAAGMPAPKTFSSATAATTISTGASLYPFQSGYRVWAGGCAAFAAGADPYTGYSLSPVSVATAPGGSYSAKVRLATLTVTTNRAWTHMKVAGDQTCADPVRNPAATSTTSTRAVFDLPYGDYDVCADNNTYFARAPAQNRTAAGSALSLSIPGSGTTNKTVCP